MPYLTATLDRVIEPTDSTPEGVLEIKTTGAQNESDWETEPPIYYLCQLQHQLLVTGMGWGSLAVLIGGQKFRYFDLPRNEDFCRFLIRELSAFWNLVESRTPPPPDGSHSTRESLHRIFRRESLDLVVGLPQESQQWAERLDAVKAQTKLLQDEQRLLENRIKAAMGEASKGLLQDGTAFTWKVQQRAEHIVAGSECRVRRRVKR
jgi:predicted phage-related endonuclease